jgi:hypothetical protein
MTLEVSASEAILALLLFISRDHHGHCEDGKVEDANSTRKVENAAP